MKSSLCFFASQVHPDPKLLTACAEYYLMKLSRDFHLSYICLSSYPCGSDLKGVMLNQKKV